MYNVRRTYTAYVLKLINNIVLLNNVLICILRILFFLVYLSKMLGIKNIFYLYLFYFQLIGTVIMIVRRMALFLLSFILTNCEGHMRRYVVYLYNYIIIHDAPTFMQLRQCLHHNLFGELKLKNSTTSILNMRSTTVGISIVLICIIVSPFVDKYGNIYIILFVFRSTSRSVQLSHSYHRLILRVFLLPFCSYRNIISCTNRAMTEQQKHYHHCSLIRPS